MQGLGDLDLWLTNHKGVLTMSKTNTTMYHYCDVRVLDTCQSAASVHLGNNGAFRVNILDTHPRGQQNSILTPRQPREKSYPSQQLDSYAAGVGFCVLAATALARVCCSRAGRLIQARLITRNLFPIDMTLRVHNQLASLLGIRASFTRANTDHHTSHRR